MVQTIDSSVEAVSGRFLDLKALAALTHMRFVTRQQIEGAYSGRHRSRQQGGAAEFADYREYVEGEDLRRLDWKVLARTGRAYVRLFQDETNLVCTLLLDASSSMTFAGTQRGSLSKLQTAQWISTALAHLIVRQQDQVGLGVVSDSLSEFHPPGGKRSHVQLIQDAIERIRPKPATDLAGGLRQLFDRQSGRGVLMLMSDFLVDDLEPVFAALRLFRHRHWEVILLHLVHPEEERLPEGQAYRFEGMEDDGRIDASPADVRKLYEEQFEAHCAAVRDSALAANCDYRRVSSSVSYLRTLSGFLVERSG